MIVQPFAVIPSWDNLTDDQRRRYQGNLDPWAGPVDPEAQARYLRRHRATQDPRDADLCGCWASDCAECGPRRADGERPAKGATRRWALRQDAALQQAKERHHEAQQAATHGHLPR